MSAAGDERVAAAIDIGSNSVLLLVVAVPSDGRARAVLEAAATTRLGTGLAAGGTLEPAAVSRTLAAAADCARRARAAGAFATWAFATGAARQATDGGTFVRRVGADAACSAEILSGEREAALAYAAVVHGLGLGGRTILAVDVGGATTELTLGRGSRIEASASLGLGALALTEAYPHDARAVAGAVAAALAGTDVPARAAAAGATVVASGGTATSLAAIALGLARYQASRVHGSTLAVERLGALAADAHAGGGAIDAGRAAILPAGACILAGVAEAAGVSTLGVSDHGVRHAYLRERLADAGVTATMEDLWR